eukprot:6184176-Pleurochrysis_carterae.AAC.6
MPYDVVTRLAVKIARIVCMPYDVVIIEREACAQQAGNHTSGGDGAKDTRMQNEGSAGFYNGDRGAADVRGLCMTRAALGKQGLEGEGLKTGQNANLNFFSTQPAWKRKRARKRASERASARE